MIDERTVLIVVDIQNDFCQCGSLAVAGADEVIPVINDLARRFEAIVLTQDWHPAGHSSFATSHIGRAPFEMIRIIASRAAGARRFIPSSICLARRP
jgi:nicotinamidase/pyrazinamidase